MGKFIDMTGQRYGRLIVLGRSPEVRRDKHIQWLCRCDCGQDTTVIGHLMRRGHTRSCGCLMVEAAAAINRSHGKSKTRTYRIWKGMHRRCSKPGSSRYEYYGGRGIAVCERWCSFENFFADMGEAGDMSLDRLDNSKGYEPGNCVWANKTVQARNQRTNRMIKHDGQTLCLAEWADHLGMSRHVIQARLKLGWSVEWALTEPVRGAVK